MSKPSSQPGRRLTLSEVAQQMGVSSDVVRTWIANSELRATDCSAKRGSLKPRWRIAPADLAEFEAKRANQSVVKVHRPRRRALAGVTEYFS